MSNVSLGPSVEVEPGGTADPASDERSAARTGEDVFGGEDNARHTAELITRFVASWERHKHEQSPELWLAEELRRSGVLSGEEEVESTAREVVASVERASASKASLHAHLDAGRSKASWLAGAIEEGAAAAGATSVGAYAADVEATLEAANSRMLDTVQNLDGTFSMAPNLDGFIAEQHHADTFNLDAAAKGSPLRARVLGPEPGERFGRNSVDVGIYDRDGRLARRYQVKYGQDAEATRRLLGEGDYRGQRKLVPSDQKSDVPGAADVVEMDGVRSRPLTKAEAKAMQERAQQEQEVREYEWNDINRIEVARSIARQALTGAAIGSGFQGARILARRTWNALCGKKNPPRSEDLEEFFESSIKSATHVGVQTAVSGAMVVAARNGWIRSLHATPAGTIANIVHVGMENAKVLYKFARGELSGEEALDAMGSSTCSAIGGLAAAVKGAAMGSVLGPVGTFVGGVAGGMAGSKIGKAVYEGGKAIVKKAAKVVRTGFERAVETVKKVARALNPLNW